MNGFEGEFNDIRCMDLLTLVNALLWLFVWQMLEERVELLVPAVLRTSKN